MCANVPTVQTGSQIGVGSYITTAGGSAIAAGAASAAIAGAGYGGMSAHASGGNIGTAMLCGGIIGRSNRCIVSLGTLWHYMVW